jgi:glutamate racemase
MVLRMKPGQKQYTILFTDSGLGGLMVMAHFRRELIKRFQGKATPHFRLVFFNAQYRSDLGYNKMATTAEKVNIFNRALQAMQSRFQPNLLGFACNTLSSIYDQTGFSKEHNHVRTIIESGELALDHFLAANLTAALAVLATPTTIASAAYRRDTRRVIRISGRDLANRIELENQSTQIEQQLQDIFKEIRQNKYTPETDQIGILLGCTHYPLIEDSILRAARNNHFTEVTLINPEEGFIHSLLQEVQDHLQQYDPAIMDTFKQETLVVSRVAIARQTQDKFSRWLRAGSPDLVKGLSDYQWDPNLF